jgi:uncharacterized protein (TIGR02301 family)
MSRGTGLPTRRLAACLVMPMVGQMVAPVLAQHTPARPHKDKPPVVLPAPSPSPPATPAPPPESKPYDPQLMRLSEILGALTYLRGLCGAPDAEEWRRRMEALLTAEGSPAVRKDRLAGAFNQGLQGYELTYRSCTANAHLVIERFLLEGGRLAREVENRYRAS